MQKHPPWPSAYPQYEVRLKPPGAQGWLTTHPLTLTVYRTNLVSSWSTDVTYFTATSSGLYWAYPVPRPICTNGPSVNERIILKWYWQVWGVNCTQQVQDSLKRLLYTLECTLSCHIKPYSLVDKCHLQVKSFKTLMRAAPKREEPAGALSAYDDDNDNVPSSTSTKMSWRF